MIPEPSDTKRAVISFSRKQAVISNSDNASTKERDGHKQGVDNKPRKD